MITGSTGSARRSDSSIVEAVESGEHDVEQRRDRCRPRAPLQALAAVSQSRTSNPAKRRASTSPRRIAASSSTTSTFARGLSRAAPARPARPAPPAASVRPASVRPASARRPSVRPSGTRSPCSPPACAPRRARAIEGLVVLAPCFFISASMCSARFWPAPGSASGVACRFVHAASMHSAARRAVISRIASGRSSAFTSSSLTARSSRASTRSQAAACRGHRPCMQARWAAAASLQPGGVLVLRRLVGLAIAALAAEGQVGRVESALSVGELARRTASRSRPCPWSWSIAANWPSAQARDRRATPAPARRPGCRSRSS